MDAALYFQLFVFIFNLNGSKSSQILSRRFQKLPTYDNYACQSNDTLFTSNVSHATVCLTLCLKLDTCYSVFFNGDQEICRGCNVMYSSRYLPVEDTGSHYYHVVQECPDSSWTSFQKSCYKLTVRGSFSTGTSECESAGGYCIFIQSDAENAFAKTFVEHDTSTWGWFIGITDCAVNTEWKYYDADISADVLDFGPNEGSDSRVCCAVMFNGFDYQWADTDCAHTYFRTVCEIEIVT